MPMNKKAVAWQAIACAPLACMPRRRSVAVTRCRRREARVYGGGRGAVVGEKVGVWCRLRQAVGGCMSARVWARRRQGCWRIIN